MSNKKELQVKMSSKFPTKKVFITTLSGLAIATALSTGAIQAEASSASNQSPVPTSVEKEREKAALVRRGVIEEDVEHSDDSQAEDVSEPQEPVEQPVEEVKEEPETQPEEVEQSTPVQKPVEQPTERVQDVVSNIGLQLPLKNANDVRGLASAGNIRYPWTANSVESVREEINKQATQESRPENISEEAMGHQWYRIQWGDTVNAIASAYGVDVDVFAEMNQITNRDLIQSGDWVILNNEQSKSVETSSNGQGGPVVPIANGDITRFNTRQDTQPTNQSNVEEQKPAVGISSEEDISPSQSENGTTQSHTGGEALNEKKSEEIGETKEEVGERQEEVDNEVDSGNFGAVVDEPIKEDKIINEGTSNDDNTHEVTIERNEVITPYEILEIESADLFEGERQVISKGIDGMYVEEIEVTTNLSDGSRTERTLKASSNAPVNEVVLVGTQALYEVTYETEVTSTTPFETKYIESDKYFVGEEVVISEGYDGSVSTTYEIRTNLQDGTKTREKYAQASSTPGHRIIARGTKELYDVTYETEVTSVTPFETKYTESDKYFIGEEVVIAEGHNGESTTTYKVTTNLKDGTQSRVQHGQASSTPGHRIIARGTKSPVITDEETVTEITPAGVKYVESDKYNVGEEVVGFEGLDGYLVTTYRITENLQDGTKTRDILRQSSNAAMPKIIFVGTKR